jgi:hypothetical protein
MIPTEIHAYLQGKTVLKLNQRNLSKALSKLGFEKQSERRLNAEHPLKGFFIKKSDSFTANVSNMESTRVSDVVSKDIVSDYNLLQQKFVVV